MSKLIRQSATFKAAPEEVYEALMDSKKHAAFTGAAAKIGREVGDRFSAYDGYIEGTNIALVRNKKIVQMWRGSDWPEGEYSNVTFKLNKIGGDTHLSFRQSGVPDNQYKAIKQGWIDFYWEPMRKMLEGK
jgi:activator of HSP90 ATPase